MNKNLESNINSIEVIVSGGSNKKIDRLIYNDNTSCIRMSMPWISDYSSGQSYYEVSSFMSQNSLNVPEIYEVNKIDNLIYVQDLGQNRLLDVLNLNTYNFNELFFYFKSLVNQIVKLQTVNLDPLEFNFLRKKYSRELLHIELEYFLTSFLIDHLGLVLKEEDERIFFREINSLINKFSLMGESIILKDMHSRNIMVKEDELFFIDFQDALIGPKLYDISSILYDQFYVLDSSFRDSVINYYLDQIEVFSKEERELVKKNIKILALHRSLKGIASYASFEKRFNKTIFLRFIGVFWTYVRQICFEIDECKGLYSLVVRLYNKT